jgi:N-acetyl sugar amidotransferase
MNKNQGKYGLPLDIKYCAKCTMSNQRPSSEKEFSSQDTNRKKVIEFDEHGICSACRHSEQKKDINWSDREVELSELCNRFRKSNGEFDCIVPGSGGKDSVYAAHILKYKYNMNPLTVTWPPNIYTNIGRYNFEAWLSSGFTNLSYFPNQKVHKLLTKYAFLNLGHPFQPFMLGQMNLAPKISVERGIPLVIYGENPAEYGSAIEENNKPTKESHYYSSEFQLDDIFLGGVPAKKIIKDNNLNYSDLDAYLPGNPFELEKCKTEVHYLGYYIRWHPQEMYYYSVENTDFMPMPYRVEGSYSKYSSMDDKMDWLHWYTYYIKFGMGRTTHDSSQEIRNGDITREEGISLIKRFDGEFPDEFLIDCCKYMGITEEAFLETIESFRTPHLWKKKGDIWELSRPIWSNF